MLIYHYHLHPYYTFYHHLKHPLQHHLSMHLLSAYVMSSLI